jgi:hypothetical protein
LRLRAPTERRDQRHSGAGNDRCLEDGAAGRLPGVRATRTHDSPFGDLTARTNACRAQRINHCH